MAALTSATSPSETRMECRPVSPAGRRTVATFGVFFLGLMRVAMRAREVEVPDLRGKSVAEARASH